MQDEDRLTDAPEILAGEPNALAIDDLPGGHRRQSYRPGPVALPPTIRATELDSDQLRDLGATFRVVLLLTLSHTTSVTLAEVAFLLMLLSGIWFFAAELQQPKWQKMRRIVASLALAVAGLLLIITTYFGTFG
jgi:hypothetical protein